MPAFDVFISHAREDKDALVRPLAERLRKKGLKVWYDEYTLSVGDSLNQKINHGLAASRFGIVVISPDFLKKAWPQKELDGLVAREVDGIKVIPSGTKSPATKSEASRPSWRTDLPSHRRGGSIMWWMNCCAL